MKSLRNILVFVLAFIVFNLGAGAGVVHICSAYCKMQTCSSISHSDIGREGCCHHSDDNIQSSRVSITEECSCINVHYNIDYFLKVSQEDDAVSFSLIPFDLPEHITYCFEPIFPGFISSQPANAPPLIYDGRTLLAFHSVLII